jgi:hypothetical protein
MSTHPSTALQESSLKASISPKHANRHAANVLFHDALIDCIDPSTYRTTTPKTHVVDKTYQAWLVQDQPAPHSFSNPPSKRIEHHLVSDT